MPLPIIIGRKKELTTLQNLLHTNEAELVAVTGRRRIGKTFLVTTAYQQQLVFEVIGTQDGLLEQQLQNFADQLTAFSHAPFPIHPPKSWSEAFRMLREYLQKTLQNDKKVLFFDELPWLAGQKSGFLAAFGYFWNSWASRQHLVVVICGSAASWMIQKVVNDKGGLHNRITKRIHLSPFSLAETEAYLQSRNIFYDRYQITQLYMAIGGIPHYLKEVDGTKSATQNIDALCFDKQGSLRDEFDRLYTALFAHAEPHIQLIRALAQKKQGVTRSDLAIATKLANGGGLTKVIEALVLSGFVTEIYPLGKKTKEKIYRLTDEYSLFYLQFIETNRQQGANTWQHLNQTQQFKSWSGYAFEGICMKHIKQIKHKLGIVGIYSVAASFYQKPNDQAEGVQIDLLLDRNDHTINLFEIKFYNQPFTLTKEYAEQLRQKMWRFQTHHKSVKYTNWILITTFGLVQNQHSSGVVANALVLDDLFGD
jgi:uncharacterized protein